MSLFFIISLFLPANTKALDKPIIGAIRWDCWFGPARPPGESCDKILSPTVWHYRAPFFGQFIRNSDGTYRVTFSALDKDSPQVEKIVRQEMASAKNAGLDYWTFLMTADSTYVNGDSYYNTFFNKYLAISQADDINFAIEAPAKADICDLVRVFPCWDPNLTHLTNAEKYYFGTNGTGGIMRHINYQKVAGGRPLMFVDFMNQTNWIDPWNNNYPGGVKAMITKFRQDAIAAGVGNPYIVLMDYKADQAADRLKKYGFDAVSAYAVTGGTSTGEPYADLVTKSVALWNWQKTYGVQVVPVVQAGWDQRPKIENPPSFDPEIKPETSNYFLNPTPVQFATNLTGAINWINNNASNSQSRVIIISAWNDNNEGSWIEPTIYEGDARLEEISRILKGTYFNTSRIKGVDLNSDRKVNFSDLQIIISNFDKPIDPTPLNADINASGRVDIYDYNLLIQNYGK